MKRKKTRKKKDKKIGETGYQLNLITYIYNIINLHKWRVHKVFSLLHSISCDVCVSVWIYVFPLEITKPPRT